MKKNLPLLFCFLFFNCLGQNDKLVIALSKNSSLELVREKFDPKNHKVGYYNNKLVVAIDNVVLFGSDGEMPKSVLKKAILKIGNKTYDLQVDNMYNPWFGASTDGKLFKLSKDGPNYALRGIFSDGAGTYAAEWIIEDGASIRTIITKDEEMIGNYFEDK